MICQSNRNVLHPGALGGSTSTMPQNWVYYNLGIVYALNSEFEKSVSSLTRYIGLVSEKDGMEAKELLASLKESLDDVL